MNNANGNASANASGSRSNVLNGEMGMYQINADVERYPFCLILYQDPLPYNPKYTLLDDDLVANVNVKSLSLLQENMYMAIRMNKKIEY